MSLLGSIPGFCTEPLGILRSATTVKQTTGLRSCPQSTHRSQQRRVAPGGRVARGLCPCLRAGPQMRGPLLHSALHGFSVPGIAYWVWAAPFLAWLLVGAGAICECPGGPQGRHPNYGELPLPTRPRLGTVADRMMLLGATSPEPPPRSSTPAPAARLCGKRRGVSSGSLYWRSTPKVA